MTEQSLVHEAAVCGSMILDSGVITGVLTVLPDSGYFENRAAATVFDAIVALHRENRLIDLIVLRDYLAAKKQLAVVGGVDFLMRTAESTPSAVNAVYYAKKVKERYIARQLQALTSQTTGDDGTLAERMNILSRDLRELQGQLDADGENQSKTEQLQGVFDSEIAGRRKSLPMPWEGLHWYTRAFLPGTVTMLCGNVGASKSLMAMQLFAHYAESGVKTALYELEEDTPFHLRRALAQKTGLSALTYPEGVSELSCAVPGIMSDNADFLQKMGKVLFDAKNQQTHEQIGQWINDRAHCGCRLIGVDPITAAVSNGKPWIADNAFLQNVKGIAVRYGCSILFITHPTKSMMYPDVNQIAGSSAFSRFAQTIVWLESHDTKNSMIKSCCGSSQSEHTRTLHILKARNSSGGGLRLAYHFDPASLCVSEIGIIVKKKKHNENEQP